MKWKKKTNIFISLVFFPFISFLRKQNHSPRRCVHLFHAAWTLKPRDHTGHLHPHFGFHTDICAHLLFNHSVGQKASFAKLWHHQRDVVRSDVVAMNHFQTGSSFSVYLKILKYPAVSLWIHWRALAYLSKDCGSHRLRALASQEMSEISIYVFLLLQRKWLYN